MMQKREENATEKEERRKWNRKDKKLIWKVEDSRIERKRSKGRGSDVEKSKTATEKEERRK